MKQVELDKQLRELNSQLLRDKAELQTKSFELDCQKRKEVDLLLEEYANSNMEYQETIDAIKKERRYHAQGTEMFIKQCEREDEQKRCMMQLTEWKRKKLRSIDAKYAELQWEITKKIQELKETVNLKKEDLRLQFEISNTNSND